VPDATPAPGDPTDGERPRPVLDIYQSVANQRACGADHHAWVPWLQIGERSWVTWCARTGCEHREQWDG
jgi:hypothetical protein